MKYSIFFELEISIFRKYIHDIHLSLEKSLEEYEEKFSEDSDEYQEYELEFKPLFITSTFIAIISFVENNLDLICRNIQFKNKYPLTKTKDKGIKKYINYIKNTHGKNDEIENIKNVIDKFYDYSKIRNIIVHNNSYAEDETDINRIKKMIPDLELEKRLSGFVFLEYEEKIKINKKFLEQLINDVEDLFKKLDLFI